ALPSCLFVCARPLLSAPLSGCRFVFQSCRSHRYLHSFPTRRSSDLAFSTSAVVLKFCAFQLFKIDCAYLTLFRAFANTDSFNARSEEHTSELQSRFDLVCRLLLEKKNRLLSTMPASRGITA